MESVLYIMSKSGKCAVVEVCRIMKSKHIQISDLVWYVDISVRVERV